MLYFFTGADRGAARAAMETLIEKKGKGRTRLTITDAHALEDLSAALSGGGMFSEERVVVLNGVLSNPEQHELLRNSLQTLRDSSDAFLLYEEKPDAVTKKQIEKYAEESKKFDTKKKETASNVFAIGNALKRADTKGAWVALQRELLLGGAPEAIHGILFWAAKDMFLKSRPASQEAARAKKLVAALAALPHEARRHGEELEYALERFLLSRP